MSGLRDFYLEKVEVLITTGVSLTGSICQGGPPQRDHMYHTWHETKLILKKMEGC